MPTEAQARIAINRLLEAAGWRLLPEGPGKPETVLCEHRVAGRRFLPTEDLGRDFEHAPGGFVDYLLLNDEGRPVGVLEAKRESIDPLSAKEQARAYAERLGVVHIFLSNGLVHYYWNLRQGNPVRVSRLLPQAELGTTARWEPDAERLGAVAVDEHYIAVSQDAAWLSYGPAEREQVMKDRKIRLLRDYQLAAIRALQAAAGPDRHRFLFEMATGTGKTLLSAAIAKLYLRTANATRVLFLVDRLELERQAERNFRHYLANDGIRTVIYKENRDDWRNADVVITTIQSLATRNRFLHEFAPTDFQLIISDEAHRTISGNNRAIFEYFVGAKLGLTATPKDYLKGVDEEERFNDPRAYERRLLLDTYRTFGCADGRPTFRYTLLDAVRHVPPYLVNPVSLDARTEITTQMLADAGYVVTVPADEDGEETEIRFERKDFERRFFSPETNLSFVRCFLEHAARDPITEEIGKTIFFAVSRAHATRLVQALNEEAARQWPEAYGAGSAFAVQITSDVARAQQMTVQFAQNNLNGKSRWRADAFRDYDTSRTRVCVTVGMMTTGYDCEDLLNVVLARPVMSPTDFVQIKGRGTRLFTFRHVDGGTVNEARKTSFSLFDFFANCEFFEEDFDYDEQLELPPERGDEGGGERPPPVGDYANTSPDPVRAVERWAIGENGMRIDREMYRDRFTAQARAAAQSDADLRDALLQGNWPAIEARIRQLLFEQDPGVWSLEQLRDLFRTDRLPTLREVLSVVFGLAPCVATRAQLAEEAFERFVADGETDARRNRELHTVFTTFLLDGECRALLQQGRFSELRTRDPALHAALTRLEPVDREQLMNHLSTRVPLGDFDTAA